MYELEREKWEARIAKLEAVVEAARMLFTPYSVGTFNKIAIDEIRKALKELDNESESG
jgi:hypothetical protein